MRTKSRPDPVIPDHEVLRKIGGGAYGEVWLARGVTGALRAVKVVWREDFEDERGFEREFEGILKFEPISRDHPGLVNILHVGRSPDGVSFYYYVMELGDDVRAGQDINPIEYEPRTLRADAKQAASPRLDPATCVDVGLRLAEALDHLHERGLAHRDVKPSNVIFVNGKAKLADIGLVAARGQRTFVGTEGFVPPEGPGSAQADVYSLGKVLYEIATGKDRLDFPELPEDIPMNSDRKRWIELNRIVCEVCEPRISKRKITTAAALAESLRRIQRGKRRRSSGVGVWLTTLMLTGFAVWAGWEVLKDSEWLAKRVTPDPPVPEKKEEFGMLRVVSSPQDADVLDADGKWIGTTPTQIIRAKVGERVDYTIRRRGHRPMQVSEVVPESAIEDPLVIFRQLLVFAPPQVGEAWEDHLGYVYQPVGEEHLGSGYVTEAVWKQFLEVSKRAGDTVEFLPFSQNGVPVKIVLANEEDSIAFCDWLRVGGNQAGFLTEDHEALPSREVSFENPGLSERARSEGLKPFRVLVRRIVYGTIELTSDPAGAEVYVNGVAVGSTIGPLSIPKVKPGAVELLLILDGYKPHTEQLGIEAGQSLVKTVKLEQNQGVVFGRPWQNGIGMRFAPLGLDLMVSVWETRVSDYALFVQETGYKSPRRPDFAQGQDHPVVNVSRVDAEAFCKWLTERERAPGMDRITVSHVYRLPTDLEWSWMAGLEEEPGLGPGWRHVRAPTNFPWGRDWPPNMKVGNFADAVAALAPGMAGDRTIPNYDDGYEKTSPVGSFPANIYGLFDLSGNVHEWVSDNYSALDGDKLGVLRGGGWNSYQPENLYTGSRNAFPPDKFDAIYGFRVVLAKVPPKSEEEDEGGREAEADDEFPTPNKDD